MGSESAQVPKGPYVPTPLVRGAETGLQDPHLPRFLRLSAGSPGIFFLPGTSSPGTFGVFSDRRTRRVPWSAYRGDEEVGKLRDPARDRGGKDYGRQGKKISRKRGKRKDDGWRKKKIDGRENRYRGQMLGLGKSPEFPGGESPEQGRFRGDVR